MWLATKYGFFSVVRTSDGMCYKIRSRVKKDLLNLFAENQIIEDKLADYRYRVIADEAMYKDFMKRLEEIDYDNFKSHIHALPDQQDKYSYYGRIWQVMYEYQERNGS